MKISLLMPTLGRVEEVKKLIDSLVNQNYKNFELIIIDQNKHNLIFELVKEFKELDIKYIRSTRKGLSYNRNIGLRYCNGDIVTLTDDDAEYPEFLLEKINEEFKKNPEIDILTISTKEKETNRTIHKSPNKDLVITNKNIFKTAISLTTFIKYKRITDIYFDEELGVGAKFGSGEESDMLLSLLSKGYKGKYICNKELVIYHPYKDEVSNPERFYLYALGAGAVLKKEIILRKNNIYIYYFIKSLIKPLIGGIINIFNPIKNKKYMNIFYGRLKGFIDYKIKGE